MDSSTRLISFPWIASKIVALAGIAFWFIPEGYGIVIKVSPLRGIILSVRNLLPVIAFSVAALIGILGCALEAHRLLKAPLPSL